MPVINLFWDNQKLGKLEKACIFSYLNNNNELQIFTYKPEIFDFVKDTKINVFNANEILPEKEKFYYTGNGDCIEGSVVGFSDIFRYELLYKIGGWYSDFDVINLKSLNSLDKSEIIIRPHYNFNYVCNIAKFPKGYEGLRELKEITQKNINVNNNNWVEPLLIFRDYVNKNNLEKYVVSEEYFGNDNSVLQQKLLFGKIYNTLPLIKSYYCMHLCGAAFKTGNWNAFAKFDFESPNKTTFLHFIYSQLNII